MLITQFNFYSLLGLSSSSAVSATINTQPVRIGPIAGGTRTFSSSGAGGSQPLTVRYEKISLIYQNSVIFHVVCKNPIKQYNLLIIL